MDDLITLVITNVPKETCQAKTGHCHDDKSLDKNLAATVDLNVLTGADPGFSFFFWGGAKDCAHITSANPKSLSKFRALMRALEALRGGGGGIDARATVNAVIFAGLIFRVWQHKNIFAGC